MEIGIAVFLGLFLTVTGGITYLRISKDFKGGDKK